LTEKFFCLIIDTKFKNSMKDTNLFKEMVEKSPVGVYLVQDWVFKYVNPKLAEIFGYKTEEIINKKGPLDLTYPDDISKVKHNIEKMLKGEVTSIHYTFRGLRKDKKIIFVEVFGSKTTYNRKPAIIGTLLDVTDKVEIAEKLRESEQKYRSLVESSPDGIFIVDKEGKFIMINKTICDFLGYKPEELIGKNIKKVISQDQWETHEQRFKQLLKGEILLEPMEYEVKSKDGKIYFVEVRSVPYIREGEFVGFQGIARNITEQKKMQEMLVHIEKMEAIGKLTGGIAHDFNNLLTTILGMTEIVLMDLKEGEKGYKELQLVREAAQRGAELVRRLLTFSKRRIETKTFINLNKEIEEIGKILPRVLGEDIRYSFFPDPEIESIIADPVQIEQIIMNLAVNARDAMSQGGEFIISTKAVTFDLNFSQTCGLKEGEYILLEVRDTGCGIPPEIKDKVFEPFFTTKPEGTGLGLSTVYGIARELEGYIDIESQVNKGTKFKIYLPVAHKEKARPAFIPAKIKSHRGKEKIMLVEDDDSIRHLLSESLKNLGYTVFEVKTGEEAIKIAREQENIDVIISDVVLVDKKGPEITKEIVKIYPEIKVIFMSGYAYDFLNGKKFEGIKAYFFPKPFTPKELATKLREVLST